MESHVADNPVKISDTTFRDGHQSLMATRLRTSDMEPIAAEMDSVGFHSMEVWGGATFDTTTRFLAEDPWERLRTFRQLMPNTPLTMLLRGQSLVGYRTYADDVVNAFVGQAAEVGIDVFRVFDALNDPRNLESAGAAIKRTGKHLQLTICYSVTEEGRLGGPIYNLDYFLDKARQLRDMGADSICIKDMAGLLSPFDAFELVTALKATLDIPLQLHTHYTSGMASMTVLKAIDAGIDVVDACLAPLALRTSQPAVEPLVVTLRGTERDCGLDLDRLLGLDDYLESVLPKYRDLLEPPRIAVIDTKVLSHQIPGGMTSNLVSQLREAGAIDRMDEVLKEIPRVRKELGYPPLVTPLSQMVGTQAVSNVLFGRYKMVSEPIKDYAYGLYGAPPTPPEPELVATLLKDYGRGQQPITTKPSDLIEPELEQAREAVKDISTDIEDALTYALYPTTGMRFLRIKHGLEPVPEEMKPPADDQPASETQAAGVPVVGKPVGEQPQRSGNTRRFNVFVGDEFFEVDVDPVGPSRPAAPMGGRVRPQDTPPEQQTEQQADALAPGEQVVSAPMPGVLLRYEVEVGQTVGEGDPVVVLEAMKMENTLPSPIAGTVRALPHEPGASVPREAILAIITP